MSLVNAPFQHIYNKEVDSISNLCGNGLSYLYLQEFYDLVLYSVCHRYRNYGIDPSRYFDTLT